MAKNLIDDEHAMKLKFYAEQWRAADKKLSDICKRKAAVLKSERIRTPKPRTAFLYSTPKGGEFSYG